MSKHGERLEKENLRLRAALEKFADPDNWEYKTEYGRYGAYDVYIWVGDGCPMTEAEDALEGA